MLHCPYRELGGYWSCVPSLSVTERTLHWELIVLRVDFYITSSDLMSQFFCFNTT